MSSSSFPFPRLGDNIISIIPYKKEMLCFEGKTGERRREKKKKPSSVSLSKKIWNSHLVWSLTLSLSRETPAKTIRNLKKRRRGKLEEAEERQLRRDGTWPSA